MKISKNWLLVAVVTSALAFVGTRVLADDAVDIESATINSSQKFDGNNDFIYGGNNADATVETVVSEPGVVGYSGRSYTAWAVLAGDASGALEIYSSSSSAAVVGWTPTEGQTISVTATYSPYHSIPEIATVTAATVSGVNEPTWASPGLLGGSQRTTIGAVLANPNANGSQGNYGALAQNLAGYLVEIDNVTISCNGTFPGTFPNTNAETTSLGTLYLNDTAGKQLTLYFWVTSYMCDGQMVGAPIPDSGNPLAPAGAIDVWGFLSSYPSVSSGITTWQDEIIPTAFVGIPEPSSFMLAGIGLLSLLAVIRRRHS
jgi:hypothetical protein